MKLFTADRRRCSTIYTMIELTIHSCIQDDDNNATVENNIHYYICCWVSSSHCSMTHASVADPKYDWDTSSLDISKCSRPTEFFTYSEQ